MNPLRLLLRLMGRVCTILFMVPAPFYAVTHPGSTGFLIWCAFLIMAARFAMGGKKDES